MRVLWITPDRFARKPDKASWWEMGRELRDRGHDVTILAGRGAGDPPAPQEPGLRVICLGSIDLPFVFRSALLAHMAVWVWRNPGPERVVILNPDALWLLPLLQGRSRAVHLDVRTLPVEVRGLKARLDRLLFWTVPLRRFASRVQGQSFITERLRQAVEQRFELPRTDHVIWHSGVNTAVFRPEPESGRSQGRRGPLRLLYHGSITRQRGLAPVIEALARLEGRVDAQLRILGDGPGLAALKRQAQALAVDDRVVFTGLVPTERVVREINAADLCICPLPARPEWEVSSPIKVLEYMACGKPMILTPIAAHRDVAADADFVVWTRGSTSADFAHAILEGAGRIEGLSQRARAAVALTEAAYTWRAQAARLADYLGDRMDAAPAGAGSLGAIDLLPRR